MSFLAIAMAAGGADLSDEQTTAVGPATIYAFLLVGGLYNLVLTGDPRTRLAGLALYLFLTAVYWRAGVARAEICLDAEAVRAPRAPDGRRGDPAADLRAGVTRPGRPRRCPRRPRGGGAARDMFQVVVVVALGLVAAASRAAGPGAAGARPVAVAGVVLGLVLWNGGGSRAASCGRGEVRAMLSVQPVAALVGAALALLAEEVIFRGPLQRALEQDLMSPGVSIRSARVAAAVLTCALGIVTLAMTAAPLTPLTIALQIAAAAGESCHRAGERRLAGAAGGLTVCTFL